MALLWLYYGSIVAHEAGSIVALLWLIKALLRLY